jgi:hypothetical protein
MNKDRIELRPDQKKWFWSWKSSRSIVEAGGKIFGFPRPRPELVSIRVSGVEILRRK